MKKLLLLGALAVCSMPIWAQDDADAPITRVIEVSIEDETGQLSGTGKLQHKNGAYNQVFNCRWISNETPAVKIEVPSLANNIGWLSCLKQSSKYNNATVNTMLAESGSPENAFIMASGTANGSEYHVYCDDPSWYVSKVEFDCWATGTDVKVHVGSDVFIVSDTYEQTNTFSHEFQYFEDALFKLTGKNNMVVCPRFVITLSKAKLEDVEDYIINKYSFDQFPMLWPVEAAEAANQAILEASTQLPEDIDIQTATTQLREVAEEELVKLNAYVNNKFFTFQDRATGKFLAAYKAEDLEDSNVNAARMIEDGTDQHAIWRLTYDETEGKFRFHNYESNLDLGNTNTANTAIPVFDHESGQPEDAPGAFFLIRPVHLKVADEDIYIVEIQDAVPGGSNHFIHDSGADYPVKLNSAEDSPASGWFVTVLDINPDGDVAGLIDLESSDIVVFNVDEQKYLSAIGESGLGYIDELRPSAVWNIRASEEGHNLANIVLRNVVNKKYIKSLSSNLTTTDQSELEVDNVEGSFETWKIFPQVQSNATDDDPTFTIKAITDEQKAQMISDLSKKFVHEFGNEPGTYHYADDADLQKYNEIKDALETINGEDSFDYVKANEGFNLASPAIFDLNALKGAALVRFKTAPENEQTINAYLVNENTTNSNKSVATYYKNPDASEVETTIFVLHNGQVSSLVDGKYLITNESCDAPYFWDPEGNENNEGLSLDFSDGSLMAIGSYLMKYAVNGNLTYYMYSNGTITSRGGATEVQGDNHIEAQSNWYGYHFCVEFVKTLSVAVDGDFKLWRSPVAVIFGENSGAYVVSVNKNQIKTEAVEASTTYGAGTTFVLTQNVTVNVDNGSAVEAVAGGLGHHATKTHILLAGKVYLTIAETSAPDPALYYDTIDDGIKIPMSVIVPEEDTEMTLPAHTPLIEAEQSEEDPLVHGTVKTITLGETHTTTTSISEINAEAAAPAAIYDLQGRRLAAPTRGINIINGSKRLVK